MTTDIRILVTGSRHWKAQGSLLKILYRTVGELRWKIIEKRDGGPSPTVTIVEGACPSGADLIAHLGAKRCGWQTERHPADWKMSPTQAGFWRNQHMVNLGADVCLAFILPCISKRCKIKEPHGSHGATDCADRAEAAGIETRRYP